MYKANLSLTAFIWIFQFNALKEIALCAVGCLSFDCAGREARNIVFHEKRVQEGNRERTQNSRGHEGSPEQGVCFDQVTHSSHGNGLHWSRRHEDEGVEEFIPAQGEAEDAR